MHVLYYDKIIYLIFKEICTVDYKYKVFSSVNSIYYIKMERLLRCNVFFNYYRVFPQSLSTVLLFGVVTSSALQVLISSRVNK